MEKKKKRPARLELDQAAQELVVVWRDGRESRFSLVELRRNCPCAACKEKREEAAQTRGLLLVDAEKDRISAKAVKVEQVGWYGLRITWADGHDHGIYSFESLRRQDENSS